MGSDKVCRTNFAVKTFCVLLAFISISNIMASFGRGVTTRGGRGYKPGTISRYRRFDNNIFTVLSDEVAVQDGAVQDADHTDFFTATQSCSSFSLVTHVNLLLLLLLLLLLFIISLYLAIQWSLVTTALHLYLYTKMSLLQWFCYCEESLNAAK